MGFLDGLVGALSDVASQILDVLVFLFNILVNILTFIWNVLQAIAQFFYTIFQDIAKFFHFVWDNFFKGIFTKLLSGIVKLSNFLKGILTPVVKFLRSVSMFIDRIYRHYLIPIIRILRIARVFLTLLRALGVKWAGKLDNILGTIQSDIQRGFLLIKGYLNVLIDLANILSDPTNLLRRPTTLLSLRRIWHAFIRQWTGLPPGFFFPSPSKGAAPGLGFLPSHFDANNPLQNPPPSYYLAFDSGVPSFSFLAPGDTIPDDSIDGVGTEDYFADSAYDPPDCVDIPGCRDAIVAAAQGALNG